MPRSPSIADIFWDIGDKYVQELLAQIRDHMEARVFEPTVKPQPVKKGRKKKMPVSKGARVTSDEAFRQRENARESRRTAQAAAKPVGHEHYETMGVSPAADIEAIQGAYKALARKYHPDLNKGNDAKMKRINAAWDWIEKNHGGKNGR